MYEIVVEVGDDPIAEAVFRALEKEVKFPRGGIEVVKRGASLVIIGRASDVTSLRSLANTIFRALYVIRGVEAI
ncbi:MAG: KEOPS complex subunit Pcc1 [Thermoproteus sp. AZ2]|jgi:tRNA threonylcarbamoyladenosine modification (KEOPS) complex  Pcc1 subunit|uniref:KEOPS complex subunit Pcc1 n=1 Tax=Thermoproteus sp. AZ2 TaxID=1609232 RepID=A0ACC6V0I9_9CREN|nr:MAG: hypothetical protein TU35_04025 [Thermoproteus sp. AZ2]